ncbi:MAG: outer membrane beta-barrel protein [Victivallales bacterium]|nr:outer membrane beta-barrel protein [Victivallales bacterium]
MKHILKATGALIISALCCLAQETASEPVVSVSEHGVKFGAGIITRHFSDTKIKGAAGSHSVTYKDRGAMKETITVEANGTSGKMDVESIDCFGPVLSLEYGIWQKDAVTLSLIGGFQYYHLDNSRHINAYATETHSFMPVNNPQFGSVIGNVSTLGDVFKAKMDMDLFILDLGLKAAYSLNESFDLFVTVGPTLTIADTESKVDGHHDSDDDCILGLYASAGAAWWFSEKISLSCEVRYDTAFEKVETKDIKQELDGFGGALKLLIAF